MTRTEILQHLTELADYIRWCERNSKDDSETKIKCRDWLDTVNIVRYRILAGMDEEDDGK